MKKLLNKKGFTLIEMLIVVAIIVILAAITVPTVSNSVSKSNKAADQANFKSAQSVAQVYAIKNVVDKDTVLFYNAADGTVSKSFPTEGYGACSVHAKDGVSPAAVVRIKFDEKLEPQFSWVRTASGDALEDACK